MICEVFELSQFCNIFIYIYTLGSSAIKRDYYAHIHVTPSCFQVLGTPTREEIKCMNPNYTEFKFPQIKPHPWHKVSLFLILLLCCAFFWYFSPGHRLITVSSCFITLSCWLYKFMPFFKDNEKVDVKLSQAIYLVIENGPF